MRAIRHCRDVNPFREPLAAECDKASVPSLAFWKGPSDEERSIHADSLGGSSKHVPDTAATVLIRSGLAWRQPWASVQILSAAFLWSTSLRGTAALSALRPGLGTFCGAWPFLHVCGVLQEYAVETAPGHRKDVRVTRAELTGESRASECISHQFRRYTLSRQNNRQIRFSIGPKLLEVNCSKL